MYSVYNVYARVYRVTSLGSLRICVGTRMRGRGCKPRDDV